MTAKPWLTSGILNSIKYKSKLFKIYKLGTVNHNTYRLYRNHLTQLVRLAKYDYYINIFSEFKNNTKKIWQNIKELAGHHQPKTMISTLPHKGVLLTKPEKIAEAINEHFSEVSTRLNVALPPAITNATDYLHGSYQNSMIASPVNSTDVMNVIKTLKNRK